MRHTNSKRVYGVPFFKITIPFINNEGDCIGFEHIRSETAEPFEYKGTQSYFKDIDGKIHECKKEAYKNHGPATEEEMNEEYG